MAQQTQAMQKVPEMVYQQAAVHQLGTLRAVYKPVWSNAIAILAFAVGAILLDLIVLAVIWNIGYIAFVLVFVPVIVLIMTLSRLINSNLRVYVFTSGLIRAKGRQMDVLRWDQIASVNQSIRRSRYGNAFTYTVQRRDGATYRFSSVLANVVLLGKLIQQEVRQQQAARLVSSGQQEKVVPKENVSANVSSPNRVCPQCGNSLAASAVFCPYCGRRYAGPGATSSTR